MSVVVSIRIPREVKEALERSGVDWRRRVKEYLVQLALQEEKRRILREARELRRRVAGDTGESHLLVREDRDAR